MLQVEVSSTVDTYFEVLGPAAYGPDFMVMVNGYAKPRKLGFADQTNVIQFVFPVEYCDAFGVDRFVELVSTMFATLPCDSGYAAPGLVWDLPDNYDGAEGVIAPLALQHHGYDVSDNASTAVLIGAKCRGARWLTMLSTELVDRVGGSDRLRGQLDAGVEVCECARGLTIRAGATPELGHVNRGEGTPLLASVARAIEPVTFFGDNAILPLFGRDIDRRDRWERRFWWNQR